MIALKILGILAVLAICFMIWFVFSIYGAMGIKEYEDSCFKKGKRPKTWFKVVWRIFYISASIIMPIVFFWSLVSKL